MFLDSNIRILETVGANFVLRFLYLIYCNYEVIKERSYELTWKMVLTWLIVDQTWIQCQSNLAF